MTIKLYSQQDNDSLMKMISQIEDPTLKALNSGPPMKLPATFKTTAFSIKSNKGGKWKIDKTPLAPTALTMASGKNFSDAYLLQLSAILYHDKEDPPMVHLIELLHLFLRHRKTVIIRRTIFELEKAKAKAHILEGLKIALDNIDEIISLIKSSADTKSAKDGLVEKFNLSEVQAGAILDMRLKRLTGLERDKIESELAELLKEIQYLSDILKSESLLNEMIKKELVDIKDKFKSKRTYNN